MYTSAEVEGVAEVNMNMNHINIIISSSRSSNDIIPEVEVEHVHPVPEALELQQHLHGRGAPEGIRGDVHVLALPVQVDALVHHRNLYTTTNKYLQCLNTIMYTVL